MAEKSTKPTTGKTRKAKAKEQAAPIVDVAELTPVMENVRREMLIATAAYFKAAQRGFAPGGEVEDWLAAEAEFNERCEATPAATPRMAATRKPRAGGSGTG